MKKKDKNRPLDIDSVFERATNRIYERSSRRGFVSKIGKFLMIITGVGVAQILPVDRTVQIAEASYPSDCNQWYQCGVATYSTCKCCINQACACPNGSTIGSFWAACCYSPLSQRNYYVYYYDCCGSAACADTCGCFRGSNNTQNWCGGAGSYVVCTASCIQSNPTC